MSRTSHPRLRSDSLLSRYSYRRHGTRLETYPFQVSQSFYLIKGTWARWVTVARPGRYCMGPAAIKRSNMKSRRRLEGLTLERRDRVEYLERKRSEEPWHREDRDLYLGLRGVRSCECDDIDYELSEECRREDEDRGWDDDRMWGEDPQSDSEVVAECASRILWIAEREGSKLAPILQSLLQQLERELEEYKPPPADRPLRQSLIHDARGAIGRDRVWHAWRMNRIDWLAGLPAEVQR